MLLNFFVLEHRAYLLRCGEVTMLDKGHWHVERVRVYAIAYTISIW